MEQYIDIVFDGPPSSEGGRFVEVENEKGHSINAGEWLERPTRCFACDASGVGACDDAPHPTYWVLRLKVKPGLNSLARKINQISTEHGFWPQDRQRALEGLQRLASKFDGVDDDIRLIEQYIMAQEVRNMGEMLMLATSELAEALEEHRDGNAVHYHELKVGPETPMTADTAAIISKMRDNAEATMLLGSDTAVHDITPEEHDALVNAGLAKPEGIAVELADCIIRCLDTMQSLGVDIDAVVDEKMRFNAGRPHKHGRAY